MLEFSRKMWRYCLIGCLAVAAGLYGIWDTDFSESGSAHISEAAAPAGRSDMAGTSGLEEFQTTLGSTAAAAETVPLAAAPALIEEKQELQETTWTVVEGEPIVESGRSQSGTELAGNAPFKEHLQPVTEVRTVGTAGSAIVQSLQQKGTPKDNYKVSEIDDDIILDAVAYISGPGDKQNTPISGTAAAGLSARTAGSRSTDKK